MSEIAKINHQKIKLLFEQARFKELIFFIRSLSHDEFLGVSSIKFELISMLSMGCESQALKRFKHYKSSYNFDKNFIKLFKRFLSRDSLNDQVSQVIDSSRETLNVYLSIKSPPSYVDHISTFENIVLISNSSSFSFSEEEKELLRRMHKPLFVYLNIGNPSIAQIRDQIYPTEASELLIGGHHHVVDSSSKLIFAPYRQSNFLGCLVRVNNRFQKLWYGDLKSKAADANPGINIFEFEEALLIDSLYPLSTYRDSNNKLHKRIPSIGWMATTFLDAVIESCCDAGSRLWLAGFSLTPTYIFHVAGNLQQHDFAFEKQTLERRFSYQKIAWLGSQSTQAKEMNAGEHLKAYGFRGQQLSKFLRSRGRI